MGLKYVAQEKGRRLVVAGALVPSSNGTVSGLSCKCWLPKNPWKEDERLVAKEVFFPLRNGGESVCISRPPISKISKSPQPSNPN